MNVLSVAPLLIPVGEQSIFVVSEVGGRIVSDVLISDTTPLAVSGSPSDRPFLETLRYAVNVVLTHFHWLLLGVLIGMVIGAIPGMGGIVTLTIMLPFTLSLTQYQTFTMMAAGVGATTFAGSITAILINTPGTSSNAATLIDGYPLTQKGKSATAIGASSLASASGAVLASIVFLVAIPLMADYMLLFGPSEIFWLVLLAILTIPLFVANNPLYGIVTGLLGCLVAFVGLAPQTAEPRFTFGSIFLQDGVELIAMLIGFFALAEIVRVASLNQNTIVDFENIDITGSMGDGMVEVIKHKWLWFRCSLIGLVIGAVPAAGGSASAFVAYAHAAQSATDTSRFGNGAIEGVIATESANDAKDGGQLFPTLGLGIPGTGSMAILLSAMLIHGVFPGPRMLVDHTEIVMIIVLSLLAANVLTSLIGLALAEQMTKLLRVPIPLLLTFIVVLSMGTVYMVRTSVLDLGLVVLFAAFGLVLIELQISRIPFLIAFILASILEHNFLLAARLGHNRLFEVFFTGTLNLLLLTTIVLSLVLYFIPVRDWVNTLVQQI